MAERITHEGFQEKVIESSKIAIVDFYSDICIPCKRMSPILNALEEQYEDKIYVAKVNVAYETELVEAYQIRSTPTFLIFKNGEIVEQFSGIKTQEELEEIIEEILD